MTIKIILISPSNVFGTKPNHYVEFIPIFLYLFKIIIWFSCNFDLCAIKMFTVIILVLRFIIKSFFQSEKQNSPLVVELYNPSKILNTNSRIETS